MSDTNSFLDAMERRTRSHRDPEDDASSSVGDGASLIGGADEDDGTGIRWQFNAENPPPALNKGSVDDDDDEVVAIHPPSEPMADDNNEFSDDDSSEAGSLEAKQPSKKSRANAKQSSSVPAKGPKPAAPKQAGSRIKWAKLVQEEVYEDGTTKTTYPFIEKDGYYLDELAAQVIIEEAPHMAGYGKGKDAWLKTAIKSRRQQDPTGKLALPSLSNAQTSAPTSRPAGTCS